MYASNTLALSNPSTSMDSVELVHSGLDYAPSADFDNGTYVEWFQEADSSYEEWTQNRMNWRFGPKLSFEIFHENGTRITEDHYALIDEKLNFSVVVPEAIFPAGKEMGMLMFYGSGAGSDDNPSIFLMAYAPGPNNITEALRLPVAFPDWDDKYPPWYALGNQFNETIMSETTSYIDAMMLDDFTVLYGDECTTKSDGFNQYYNFIVSLTNDTPRMLYGIGMMVFDTEFNMVADYEYGSTRELQGVAVGIHPSEAWQDTYGGTYTLEKLDFMDNTLYSVARGQDFRMRFNISGDTPESVQMGFEIPQDMYVTINRTGWHWELVTEQGGWVYDDIQDTYLWNDTIDVTYEDYVYGPYEMHDYAQVADDILVEVRYLYYDDFIGYYVQNVTTKAFREFRFIYNSTTDSFESHFGYEVWSYPYDTYVEGVWEERVWVEETPQEVLFELNGPLCDATQIEEEFIVEFVGHFTENMPVTEDSSYDYFNIWVVGPTGRSYSHSNERQPSSDFDLAKRIIIESPVTIAKVLTESGEEPLSWLFQINKGERFQVLGRLQGGAPLAPEIDAVQLIMRASDGYWTPDESRWSTVTYEITMEMDGTPILRAFNLTEMQNWTYGIYHDYVLV
ncbi:MAG: hypothetical protein ACFFAY_14790, partial [Promethearchaeota archaeon]